MTVVKIKPKSANMEPKIKEPKSPVTAASLRKEVYTFLHEEGYGLNDRQKGALSKILKGVLEHRVIESRKENDAPLRHEVVCPKCQGITLRSSASFKRYRKNIKRAGGAVTQ